MLIKKWSLWAGAVPSGANAIVQGRQLLTMVAAARVQVREIPPNAKLIKKWSLWEGSNRRPVDYESTALPTEPHKHVMSTDNRKSVLIFYIILFLFFILLFLLFIFIFCEHFYQKSCSILSKTYLL